MSAAMQTYAMSNRARIFAQLASGPKTRVQLIKETGLGQAQVHAALQSLQEDGKVIYTTPPGTKTFLWERIPERPIDRLMSVGWLMPLPLPIDAH